MNLGENIYKYRSQQNMSQLDLADALGVSRQSVSKWETNAAVPELDKLISMADLFDVSLDELARGKAATDAVPSPGEPAPAPLAVKALSPRELIGAFLIFLAIAALLVGLLLGGLEGLWVCMYFALVLGTVACACCWPTKQIVMGCTYAADLLYVLVLSFSGGYLNLIIFGLPFLAIYLILEFIAYKKGT